MAQPTVIVVNLSATPVVLKDFGSIIVPGSGQVNLTNIPIHEVTSSDELDNLINTNILRINDGINTLNKQDSISYTTAIALTSTNQQVDKTVTLVQANSADWNAGGTGGRPLSADDARYVNLSGDTMTGPLSVLGQGDSFLWNSTFTTVKANSGQWEDASGGGLSLQFEWRYSSSGGAPSSRQFKTTPGDALSATLIQFSDSTLNNIDVGAILNSFEEGDIIYLQQKDNKTISGIYEISSVTDQGSYVDFNVTTTDVGLTGGNFNNNRDYIAILISTDSAGSEVNTIVAANSAKWNSTHTTVNANSARWGNSVQETITFANTFSALDVVRMDGSSFVKSKADTDVNANVYGVVLSASASDFTVVYEGVLEATAHGFPVGSDLYLSDTTSGRLTATSPVTVGSFSVPIGQVKNANEIVIRPLRGFENFESVDDLDIRYVNIVGDTMTGTLSVLNEGSSTQWNDTRSTVNANSARWGEVVPSNSVTEIITFTNSFNALDVIRLDGSSYVKSIANYPAGANVFGVVLSANSNAFSVVYDGILSATGHGFTAGADLFLSDSVSGSLVETPPTAAGSYNVPVAQAKNANEIVIRHLRGLEIQETENLNNKFVSVSGDTMTGTLVVTNEGSSTDWYNAYTYSNENSARLVQSFLDNRFVNVSGDVMTGNLEAPNLYINSANNGLSAGGTYSLWGYNSDGNPTQIISLNNDQDAITIGRFGAYPTKKLFINLGSGFVEHTFDTEVVRFNAAGQDRDLIIEKIGGADAYKYDAGDDLHTFSAPLSVGSTLATVAYFYRNDAGQLNVNFGNQNRIWGHRVNTSGDYRLRNQTAGISPFQVELSAVDASLRLTEESNLDIQGIIEAPYQNYLAHSENLHDSAWTKFAGVTITGYADGPFPGTVADVADFASNGLRLRQTGIGISASTNYTFSVWARLQSGNGAINADLGDGTKFSFTATSTWQRFIITVDSGAQDWLDIDKTGGAGIVEFFGWMLHDDDGGVAHPYLRTKTSNETSQSDEILVPFFPIGQRREVNFFLDFNGSNEAFQTIARYRFPGTDNISLQGVPTMYAITEISDTGETGTVRIQDTTNGNTVASMNFNNGTAAIQTGIEMDNLSESEAIWEVQSLITNNKDTYDIYSVQLEL